jgi:hypothetical protein
MALARNRGAEVAETDQLSPMQPPADRKAHAQRVEYARTQRGKKTHDAS